MQAPHSSALNSLRTLRANPTLCTAPTSVAGTYQNAVAGADRAYEQVDHCAGGEALILCAGWVTCVPGRSAVPQRGA